jgi:hypothetical protein
MLNKAVLERKAEKARIAMGITPKQAETIQYEAHGLYQYIGADLPPDNKKRGTCRRATIIEVVLDAGRLEEQLKRKDEALAKAVFAADYQTLIALVGPAFPYAEYEVNGESID